MTEAQAWMNGRQLRFSEMQLPVWDLGVVAGASITEMARTFAHRPFRLPEHLARLLSSCHELGFDAPFADTELLSSAETIVQHNATLIDKTADLGIVMFVTAGANRTYLGEGELPGPNVGIHTFPLPFALWRDAAVNGARLHVPARRQFSNDSLPVEFKTRNRLHWWLADREANAAQAGSRALLMDANGFLTETSTSCFYAVIDNEIVTPKQNVLASMSRRMVQEAAEAAGLKFRRGDIAIRDLPNVQQVFLSSTPVGVLPVQSISLNAADASPNGTANFNFPVDQNSELLQTLRGYWKQQTGIDPTQQMVAVHRERPK